MMLHKIEVILRLCVLAAALFAALSAAYYYAAYLPQRDAQLETERKLEKSRIDEAARSERIKAEEAKRAEQNRILLEQRAAEQRQQNEKNSVQARYQSCKSRAEDNYETGWANECKRINDIRIKNYKDCLSSARTKESCELFKSDINTSPNCSLPRAIGTDLETSLEKARDRCLQESKAGMQ